MGLSNALLLSSRHHVELYDINEKKRQAIKKVDFSCLDEKNLNNFPININNIRVIDNISPDKYDFVIIALPTDSKLDGKLDISTIVSAIKDIREEGIDSHIIIRSTLPITGSQSIIDQVGRFTYVPEFLREGTAVNDSFYPSRIVVGGTDESAQIASELFSKCALNNPKVLLTNHVEAECIKLFSNTYLAMRVAFFNELDTFMLENKINADKVLQGMALDDRIGNYYNNPSFGFGGYCLPKDTEEVINSINSKMISQINVSNLFRIQSLAKHICELGFNNIGVYKLSSKIESSGIRNSSTILLIEALKKCNKNVYIYDSIDFIIEGCVRINSIERLFELSDIVIANRLDNHVKQYKDKIFTRDIFSRN